MIRVQPVVRPAITVTCACPLSSVIAAPRFEQFIGSQVLGSVSFCMIVISLKSTAKVTRALRKGNS